MPVVANMGEQRVLITGASSGIGEQLALDYAANGWQVIACGRNLEALGALHQQHDNIKPLSFDINSLGSIKQALADVAAKDLDLVILNAGVCEYIDTPMQFDSALFERVIQTNVIAVGYCLEAMLPCIRTGGRIALMSSSASFLSLPRAEAYGASKAAVSYLAHTLAIDIAPKQLGVSVIHPGFVKTPLTDKNDFPMPMRISVEQASAAIRTDLAKGKTEINFPSRFTWILKTMALLPTSLWRWMARKGLAGSNQ